MLWFGGPVADANVVNQAGEEGAKFGVLAAADVQTSVGRCQSNLRVCRHQNVTLASLNARSLDAADY
jgi:hypothetical protein